MSERKWFLLSMILLALFVILVYVLAVELTLAILIVIVCQYIILIAIGIIERKGKDFFLWLLAWTILFAILFLLSKI